MLYCLSFKLHSMNCRKTNTNAKMFLFAKHFPCVDEVFSNLITWECKQAIISSQQDKQGIKFFTCLTWASSAHDGKGTFFMVFKCFSSFSTMWTHVQACICWSKYTTFNLVRFITQLFLPSFFWTSITHSNITVSVSLYQSLTNLVTSCALIGTVSQVQWTESGQSQNQFRKCSC